MSACSIKKPNRKSTEPQTIVQEQEQQDWERETQEVVVGQAPPDEKLTRYHISSDTEFQSMLERVKNVEKEEELDAAEAGIRSYLTRKVEENDIRYFKMDTQIFILQIMENSNDVITIQYWYPPDFKKGPN